MEKGENKEHDQDDELNKFYKDAETYWNDVKPTVDGMLGGFSKVSPADIAYSSKVIKQLILDKKLKKITRRCVDCGAGIGRVTKDLLMQFFDTIDMVEVTKSFLDESYNYIGETSKKVNRVNLPIQDFNPEPKIYDVIWCQWVTGHLTDEAFVDFLIRAQISLASSRHSVIVVKDNVVSTDEADFDETDSSYTRPVKDIKLLFDKANLEIIYEGKQPNFPKELYPVMLFVLRSKEE